ncbi:UDP-N-acetylglucosamine transporter-like [Thraustotheca clavata]|uniref:UDP-N-acetylglucosamine transporter-like n=1 Tax=Thraustotheca clavata TaxID=74557 RepID=A0A1V9Z172_9STRA|nr:UDP-N-acetylglucosamine transporter-like [Thraustotheca clavata]
MPSAYDKVLATSRKLRKSCSLPTCSQRPGECMHCTCDGRCGQHEGGKCGVRREGSGKSCKRLGCPKDDTCLHSTRATCCHCRNLVSSQSRSLKAKRALDESENMDTNAMETPKPIVPLAAPSLVPVMDKTKVLNAANDAKRRKRNNTFDKTLQQDKMKKRITKMITPAAPTPSLKPKKPAVVAPVLGTPSLCEYPEWSSRRSTCNLIVVVEGTQFNLHQFPMLVACPELRTKLKQQQAASDDSVSVLKYAHFPGGAAAFELACIHAYTGSMDINASNVALLYCAARILKMHVALTSRCATLLETLAHAGTGMDVVQMLLQVVEIRKCLRNQSTDRMMALCVNAISQRYPYEENTMQWIVKLPCDVFLHITQLILNDQPNSTVNNVVARLCAQAHLAQVFRSVQSPKEKACELIKVLDILMTLDTSSVLDTNEDVDMTVEEGEIKEDKRVTAEMLAQAFAMSQTSLMGSFVVYGCMAGLSLQFGLQPLVNRAYAGQVTNRSMLVVVCELAKLILAVFTILVKQQKNPQLLVNWTLKESLWLSGLPACTYAVQNVLIQLAMQHLSPLEFNLINQSKLIWTALFVYLLLKKPFSWQQCGAMGMLLVASVLLSTKENEVTSKELTMSTFYYGYLPVICASILSGIGAALTQMSLQTHARDASVVTIELCVYGSLFLLGNLVLTPGDVFDFKGWTYWTIVPAVTNAIGGLLVGTVTQLAGGIMKSYSLIGGILLTAIAESLLSESFVLSNQVYFATVLVISSMYIYSIYPYQSPKKKIA